MSKPVKRGRPRRTKGITSLVGIRMSASERDACERAARTQNVTLSEWIRRAIASVLTIV